MVAQIKHFKADLYPVPEPKIQFLDDLDCVICSDHSCINCQLIQKENADWLLNSIPEAIHGYSEPGVGFDDFNESYYGMYA
jgi:hypothetical protein